MSLYNMVCGNNPLFTLLHAILERSAPLPEIPRYRDTYTTEEHGVPRIVIYTRTGGSNRSAHLAENAALAAHPLFVSDADDDHDTTFAHFSFRVPTEWNERVLKLHSFLSKTDKGCTPREKFERAMAVMDPSRGAVARPPAPTEDEFNAFTELVAAMARELRLVPAE